MILPARNHSPRAGWMVPKCFVGQGNTFAIPRALVVISALLCGSLVTADAIAQQSACGTQQTAIDYAFSSGAMWSLCLMVEESHGLTITSASYRAPGDSQRNVLQLAHIGQVLLHYHDEPDPIPQLDVAHHQERQSQGSDVLSMNDNTCAGTVLDMNDHPAAVCARVRDNRTLAKYAQRPSLHSRSLELSSAFQRDTLTWTVSFTFTEDGQVSPGLGLSGRASRTLADSRYSQTVAAHLPPLVRATVLATWRLVFDLDTPAIDTIEQYEFPLDAADGNRRPMQVTTLTTERQLRANRETFRGWRIVDASGAGYYLDPANNGFSYTHPRMHWPGYELALTRLKPCERFAAGNATVSLASRTESSTAESSPVCGLSLDDFVNGESLQGAPPVVWYGQSRVLDPHREHWPVIRNVRLTFDLLPFDWTASSPFEPVD
ncbi:MAG: hypothetical protein HKN42_17440 [Granulosicoccus sp.]|nr:hypothetical protein [Granulosicoccus sp.]